MIYTAKIKMTVGEIMGGSVRGLWEISVLPAQFGGEPKTVLRKMKSVTKKKRNEMK